MRRKALLVTSTACSPGVKAKRNRIQLHKIAVAAIGAVCLTVLPIQRIHAAPQCDPGDPQPPTVCEAGPRPTEPPTTPTNLKEFQWGQSGDVPVPARYLASSTHDDLAVWRPAEGTWYVKSTDTGEVVRRQWGLLGDVPVPGDFPVTDVLTSRSGAQVTAHGMC